VSNRFLFFPSRLLASEEVKIPRANSLNCPWFLLNRAMAQTGTHGYALAARNGNFFSRINIRDV
jgi:hypothetical protein